jgi:outer membrane biosynthesis protein TonB
MIQAVKCIAVLLVAICTQAYAQPMQHSSTIAATTIVASTNTNNNVQAMPSLAGSLTWQQFVNNNAQYPENALAKDIEGEVVVEFWISLSEKVSQIKTTSGHYDLIPEAERLATLSSGQWQLPYYLGNSSYIHYQTTIAFALTTNAKK